MKAAFICNTGGPETTAFRDMPVPEMRGNDGSVKCLPLLTIRFLNLLRHASTSIPKKMRWCKSLDVELV